MSELHAVRHLLQRTHCNTDELPRGVPPTHLIYLLRSMSIMLLCVERGVPQSLWIHKWCVECEVNLLLF